MGNKGPANNATFDMWTVSGAEDASRRETINLNAFSSVDEGPVNNADTQHIDSVGNLEHQKSEPSKYYRSVQRWRLECTVEEASTDTVTVLQGAFMKDGVERLATPQETLLLHTVYKPWSAGLRTSPPAKKDRRYLRQPWACLTSD